MIEAGLAELSMLTLRWPVAAALLTATIRSAVLVAGALAAAHLLRSEASSSRRALWSATLGGLAVIGGLAVVDASGLAPEADRWSAAQDWPYRGVATAAVWGLPAAALLLRLVRSRLASRRLAATAVPVADASWLRELQEAAGAVGVDGRVQLRHSTAVACPVVCGVARPCLVVPDAFLDADPILRRAVLMHELEHLRARDVLTRQLGLLTRALLWFSPATWLALRHARIESERAGDERALMCGIRPSLYAQHLATLAIAAPPGEWAGASAALAGSELEARLVNLSRMAAWRQPARRPLRAVLAASLALAVFVAALGFHLPRPRLYFVQAGAAATEAAAE